MSQHTQINNSSNTPIKLAESITNEYLDKTAEDLATIASISIAVLCFLLVIIQTIAIIIMCKCKRLLFQIKYSGLGCLSSEVMASFSLLVHQLFFLLANYHLPSRILLTGYFKSVSWTMFILISTDRTIAVARPLLYQTIMTQSRIVVVLILNWILPLLLFSITLYIDYQSNNLEGSMRYTHYAWTSRRALLFVHVLFLFVYMVTYLIARKHLQVRMDNDGIQRAQNVVDSELSNAVSSLRKLTSAFCVLHLPLIICSIFDVGFEGSAVPRWLDTITQGISFICIQASALLTARQYLYVFEECRLHFYETFLGWNRTYSRRIQELRQNVYNIVIVPRSQV